MPSVTISKEEYIDLLIASERLSRLECGGVDNWEWYGESLNGNGPIDLFEAKLKLKYGIELSQYDLAVLEEEGEPKLEEEDDE